MDWCYLTVFFIQNLFGFIVGGDVTMIYCWWHTVLIGNNGCYKIISMYKG